MTAIRRRTFLRQGLAAGVLIAGGGAAQLAHWLQPSARGGDGPPAPRLVAAWLRMAPVSGQGPIFDVPSSEAAYVSNTGTIDVALPANGGKLQADGTWLQERAKLETDWARRLPAVARESGHRYLPIVGNDRRGIYSVLAERRLQRRANQVHEDEAFVVAGINDVHAGAVLKRIGVDGIVFERVEPDLQLSRQATIFRLDVRRRMTGGHLVEEGGQEFASLESFAGDGRPRLSQRLAHARSVGNMDGATVCDGVRCGHVHLLADECAPRATRAGTCRHGMRTA